MSQIEFHRGDVILVEIPFVERHKGKLRPAVIIQNDAGNKYSANLIVAAISSRVPPSPLPVQYVVRKDSPSAQMAGLHRTSVVDCGNIATVSKKLVRRKLGRFPPDTMAEIDKCLKISLALE